MAKKKTPKLTPAFEKAYQSLNPSQKQAVSIIDGPVMVIAGPGTGKTQIIATRIANILVKTDTDPSAILALTFTDSGATAMRERLIELIGQNGYKVNISTFHSFASDIIQSYPEYFIHSRTIQPLTDIERYQIITQIIDKHQFEILKPVNAPNYYVSSIISSIQSLKREAISPRRFHSVLKKELNQLIKLNPKLSRSEFNLRQKGISKNLELLEIYKRYQKSLIKIGRYDFEDMINWVIDALKEHPDLLLTLQERFQYFLADEYQDTNSAQNEILSLLTSYWGSQANLFVVLDDEQSIYRFQGASLENALNFKDKYPNASIITLTHNYRSQQHILDAARAVVDRNTASLQNTFSQINRQLLSQTSYKLRKINLVKTSHPLFEQLFLSQKISRLIDSGVNPSEIAVIARHNADLPPIANHLSQHQIKNRILGSHDILNTTVVKYLIKLLRVIHQSRTGIEDINLFTLLLYPFLDIPPLDVHRLSRYASRQRISLFDAILDYPQSEPVLESLQKIQKFIHNLSLWNQQDATLTFVEFIQTLLEQSSLLNWILIQPNSTEHLYHLNTFFETIKQLNANDHRLNLEKFINHLDLITQYQLTLPSPEIDLTPEHVTLTTAHRAKGLEWSYVFIVNCIDGKWGNQTVRDLIPLPSALLRHNRSDPLQNIEDERRLFYVALTRAKKLATITFSSSRPTPSKTQPTLPSQFIHEIPSKLISTKTYQPSPTLINNLLHEHLVTHQSTDSSNEEEFLISILQDFRLSATALDTYLECSYKFKLNNLLRVPRAKEAYLSYGTSIHAALEHFYRQFLLSNKLPSKKYLITSFTQSLKQETLTDKDYQIRLAQGKKTLSAYYDLHKHRFTKPLFVEKYFGYSSSPIKLGDISLVGKIDRIELINPRTKSIKIIDYKTGQKKTRGQIEGTTQDSNGSYKRQLIFYKLLIELDSNFPYQVTQAELDFVESPSQDGKSGVVSFTLTSKEVADLKETISATMKQIRSLNFTKTEDYSVCHRCEFKDHCWPNGVPQYSKQQLPLSKTTPENSLET